MSTLVFDELITELNQTVIVTNQKGFKSFALKLLFYMHSNPTGDFLLEIFDADDILICEKQFDASYLKERLHTSDSCLYGWIYFDFSHFSLTSGSYKIKLSCIDHIYSENSFLGWCKDWESNFEQNDTLNEIEWTQWPLGLRIISLEPREF